MKRKILLEDKCEQCGVEVETVLHALWECAMLDDIWDGVSDFEDRRQLGISNIRDLIILVREKRKNIDLMAMVMWTIWHRRNQIRVSTNDFPKAQLGKAGLGVVIHDCQGKAIASLSEQAPLPFSPVIVEAMAAARVMSFTQELGISEFMLEGDSEVVINSLRSKEPSLSSFGHILESAKSSLVTSKCIAFSHVRRTGNKVAHNLARHARHVRGLSVWVEDVPPLLYDVLFADPV
ncbi:uncharacterized protein LOC142625412 [Castanea sativa]|uniref:uncharacterized protein LOC142625412 n=1 Tax=Castanea sativa TaxID=21020 RepID=UPI003F64D2E8